MANDGYRWLESRVLSTASRQQGSQLTLRTFSNFDWKEKNTRQCMVSCCIGATQVSMSKTLQKHSTNGLLYLVVILTIWMMMNLFPPTQACWADEQLWATEQRFLGCGWRIWMQRLKIGAHTKPTLNCTHVMHWIIVKSYLNDNDFRRNHEQLNWYHGD